MSNEHRKLVIAAEHNTIGGHSVWLRLQLEAAKQAVYDAMDDVNLANGILRLP
jgi:hypothetical protein